MYFLIYAELFERCFFGFEYLHVDILESYTMNLKQKLTDVN